MNLDWTGVAGIAAVVTIAIQVGRLALGAYRRHSRQLSLLGSRLNEKMCGIEVIYDAQGQILEGQLIVTGLWPKKLFLLPGGGATKTLPNGTKSIDGDWLSMRAVTCRMGKDNHGRLFASVHVWSKAPFKSAVLMVTVRDRASAKALISRIRIIDPMA
jgi:hypothetical protein